MGTITWSLDPVVRTAWAEQPDHVDHIIDPSHDTVVYAIRVEISSTIFQNLPIDRLGEKQLM